MAMTAGRQPLYAQLVDVLREKITDDMSAGDALPSERQLSERYGLSRTTVRLALDNLERMGLVVREHGRGTFVADPAKDAADLSLCYSFTEEMRRLGRRPSTRVISFRPEEANKGVAQALRLRLGAGVYHLHRLRLADGVPMLEGHTFLPRSVVGEIGEGEVALDPLYDVLQRECGQRVTTAEEEVTASTARAGEAELLGIEAGAPALAIVRVSYNARGTAIEYTRSVARADKFKYHVVHSRP